MARRAGVHKAANAAALAGGVLCGLLTAGQASALGLGEMNLQSFLNEPLRAELALLDLRDVSAEDVRIRLGSREDFARRGIDRSYFLTSIQFEIDVDGGSNRGIIRLTTEDPVLEPYIDLLVEVRWPTGRLLREYTVLVDPPTFRQETVTVSAADAVARAEPETAPAASRETGGTSGTGAAAGEESVSSGDTVRRLESDLPPGEMPDRPFSEATADQPRAGSRYMVKRDETLWEIAADARPSGVPVQQAMLDIQRLNPEAFIDNNINRIKAGYIIYLPDAGDISSDDLAEALQEVRQQNQDFAAGRRTPGVTAAATLRVSAAPSPTPTAAAAAESGSVSSAGRSGDLSSDASDAMADSSASPDRDSVSPVMGDAPSAAATDSTAGADSRASAELAAQVSAMTDRLDTLEEIVALKDEQIAALQESLREAREAAAAPAAVAPAAPAASSAPRPAAPAARPAASSDLPWLPIGGGVAVILALLALFLVRRRNKDIDGSELPQRGREDSTDDDVFAGVKLKKEALAAAPTTSAAIAANAADEQQDEDELSLADPDAGMEPLQTDGGSRGYGERKHDDYIDEGAAGDALAEADIYIAYGRYLQAIELLDTAIEEEPENSAYRLKLIELYVDMGEDDNAAEQLDKLRAGGDREAILRGEALVGGAAAGTASAPGAPPPPAPAPDPLDPMEMDTLPEVEAAPDAEPAPRVPEPAPESDLDLEASPFADDVAEELPLDLEPGSEEVAAAAPPVDDALPEDMDLDAPADMEFDELQIDEDDGGGEEQLDLMADDDGEEELDLSDALAAMEAVEAAHADAESSSDSDDNSDSSGDEFLVAEDADQMATKLDLARAYLDMGDGDGARGILEEVMSAGTAEQQQEARELLSRVD